MTSLKRREREGKMIERYNANSLTLVWGTLKKLSLWSQTTNLESRIMVRNPYGL